MLRPRARSVGLASTDPEAQADPAAHGQGHDGRPAAARQLQRPLVNVAEGAPRTVHRHPHVPPLAQAAQHHPAEQLRPLRMARAVDLGHGRRGGLGLSVTYGLVQAHGGDISFETRQGKGTTFTIKLPVVAKSLDKIELIKSVPLQKRRARILVVEDENEVRQLLSDILASEGHEVEAADCVDPCGLQE